MSKDKESPPLLFTKMDVWCWGLGTILMLLVYNRDCMD